MTVSKTNDRVCTTLQLPRPNTLSTRSRIGKRGRRVEFCGSFVRIRDTRGARDKAPLEASNPLMSALDRLERAIGAHRSLLVAFSGGVDSTLLLKVAHTVLGDRAGGAIAVSASLPASELGEAKGLASLIGAVLYLVPTHELEDKRYAANPLNRCYFCKSELFEVLGREAAKHGFEKVAYGANLDDRGDFRPGTQAANEHAAVAPLLEAGLGKGEIRRMARALGLPNWDKPARACLSSRIPHGVEVTTERLGAIEKAEEGLYALGFRQVRVRWHGEVARLELGEEEMGRLADAGLRAAAVAAVRASGFRFVALDLDGYKRGSLNPGSYPMGPAADGGQ